MLALRVDFGWVVGGVTDSVSSLIWHILSLNWHVLSLIWHILSLNWHSLSIIWRASSLFGLVVVCARIGIFGDWRSSCLIFAIFLLFFQMS